MPRSVGHVDRRGAGLLSSPGRIIVGSFVAAIAVGTGLHALPMATASGVGAGPVDALFTATSAVCVTGLVTVDTGTSGRASARA